MLGVPTFIKLVLKQKESGEAHDVVRHRRPVMSSDYLEVISYRISHQIALNHGVSNLYTICSGCQRSAPPHRLDFSKGREYDLGLLAVFCGEC